MSGLGSLLRRHREAARLTQEELADRAGVSARTVSDIERGLRSRIYPDTARRLSDALGLTDGESATFVDVARGRSSSRGGASAQGRVPRPLTRLLGRDREVDELVDTLGQPDGDRLVTVTGLGGIGKTRLALAAAAELEPLFEGRVHLLRIDANQDPSLFMGVLARSLGLSDRATPHALAQHLAGPSSLLILDAFEHVLDAAGQVEDALSAAPELRILVTSRQRLGVTGERELALMPLALPEPSDPRWAEAPAAALFLDRVRAHTPDLEPPSADVIDICRRVSGVPLALELAAGRVRHLPVAALRDRLHRGMGDLAEPATNQPDRRRSMEETLRWSIATLTADEWAVLRVAALFPGGWRLDVAQQLCRADLDVVLATSGLVDRSLVLLDRSPAGDGEVPRWRMLDVVRDYVREQLGQEVPADLRTGFLAFYLGLVSEVQEHLGREHEWFELLAAEEPNVRTALTWAAEGQDAEGLLRLAGGMWQFWQARGALSEGRRWLATGLSLSPPADDATRMTAWWGAGWLAYHQGDDTAAEKAAGELVELARRHGDDGGLRNALTIHGMVAISRECTADAVRLIADALRIARSLGPGWILATSLLNMGLAHLAAADIPRARQVLAEALAAYEELADERFRARCLGYLGLASLLEDDPARARALFRQSLAVFGDLGEPEGTAEGLAGIAAVDAATGHPARAAQLAGAAERLHETYFGRPLPLERRATARYLTSAEGLVGPDAWAAEWSRGRALSLADAIDLALSGRP